MGKSVRSKSRIKARNVRREHLFNPVASARLDRCLAVLHRDSKVISPPVLPADETQRFSFLSHFTSPTAALVDGAAASGLASGKPKAQSRSSVVKSKKNAATAHGAAAKKPLKGNIKPVVSKKLDSKALATTVAASSSPSTVTESACIQSQMMDIDSITSIPPKPRNKTRSLALTKRNKSKRGSTAAKKSPKKTSKHGAKSNDTRKKTLVKRCAAGIAIKKRTKSGKVVTKVKWA